jgi:hypothetical protein
MLEQIRTALIARNETESWRYLEEKTGINAAQLCGFASGSRTIGIKNLEILAEYLGFYLSQK